MMATSQISLKEYMDMNIQGRHIQEHGSTPPLVALTAIWMSTIRLQKPEVTQ